MAATEQGEHWADWGLLVEAGTSKDIGSHEIAAGLLLEKELTNRWVATANILIEYESGRGIKNEIESALRAQIRYRNSMEFDPAIGVAFSWSPHLVALILSPVATELPEILNSVIWVRQGKERLAVANISGAMMIQATIPSALGLFFTPWLFDQSLIISGVITTIAIVILWRMFSSGRVDSRKLPLIGLLYFAFAIALIIL